MMCLHLGCGTVYLKDYVNCDIGGVLAKDNPELVEQNITTVKKYYKYPYGDPYKDIGKRPGGNQIVVDMNLDLSKIPYPFEDNSVQGILAVSILEHFTDGEARWLLKEWNRILESNGVVYIDVPDLIKTAVYLKSDNHEMVKWAISLIYGSQKNEYSFHKWGYTPDMLVDLCIDCGFSDAIYRKSVIKHNYPMFMVKAVK